MSYRALAVTTTDGRTVDVATVGDPTGHTVFLHHGSPASAVLARMFEAVADSAGLFVVALSRPGYGGSTRQEGRRVASVVEDVRRVLDELGREHYVSVGWSGGGPHALSCAALDAPRCRAAWSLAGVAPADVDFDWTEGMGPENLEEFALAQAGGPAYEAHMASVGAEFANATPENVVALFGGLLSGPDKAALADEGARSSLAECSRDAFRLTWRGFFDDDRAMLSPWGFDLAAISVPVEVWYGDQDLMVPPTHGGWLARAIPGARAVHLAEEGHVSLIVNRLDELAAAFAVADTAPGP
jgi:pimeloyl-ACP methyl ester carboxylesterase